MARGTRGRAETGRDAEALAQLLAVRLTAGSIREPRVRFDEPSGLTRDFMVGWGVVASYVRLAGVTKRKAERFVAQDARRTMSLGVEAGAEYLRGLRAGLSAAVAR